MQCFAAEQKVGFIGKGAEAGFRLCEQALAIDPKNVPAMNTLSFKFWLPVIYGRSADPKSDIGHADELLSRALAIDPNSAPLTFISLMFLRCSRASTNRSRRPNARWN